MKNLILLLVLIISSCTKNITPPLQSQPHKPYLPSENNFVMELAPSTINLEMSGAVLNGTLADFSESINFDEIYSGAKVNKRIEIFAKSDIPNLDISGFRTAEVFLFKSSNCGYGSG